VDEDDDVALWGGPKRKKGAKKSSAAANRILSQQDEEEEGYTWRKSPALSLWYLPVTDRLRALFGNLEDAKLMSWHASAHQLTARRMMACCGTHPMANSGKILTRHTQNLVRSLGTFGSRSVLTG